MAPERLLPDDPLEFVRRCVPERKIRWTYHVNMRLMGRSISRRVILESTATYEMIEEYPEDKYLPNYLVYCRHQSGVLHILFAADVAGDNVRVITAYRPDPHEWEEDLKTRRKPQ